MKTLLKLCAVSACVLVAPLAVFAAPVLIADVNITNVSVNTANGVMDGTFGIMSSLGSQMNVSYGLIVQGTVSGSLLASTVEGTIPLLAQGSSLSEHFSYTLPTYLPEAGDLYLVATNDSGLNLATVKVGSVAKGTPTASCTGTSDTITCSSGASGTVAITVSEGASQGKVLSTTSSPLSAGKLAVNLSSLVAQLSPGIYGVSFVVNNGSGAVKGAYLTSYAKPGTFGRIVSISPVATTSNSRSQVITTVSVSAVLSTSTPLVLSADAGKCGAVSTPVTGVVSTLAFDTTCPSGTVTVTLKGQNVLDTMQGSFIFPPSARPSSSSSPLLVLLALLLVAALVYAALRWHAGRRIPPIIALLFLIFFAPPAHAATYAVGSAPGYLQYEYYQIIGSLAEPTGPGPAYMTSALITTPDAVAPGSIYPITASNVSIAFSPGSTYCGTSLGTVPCGPNNSFVTVERNAPSIVFVSTGKYAGSIRTFYTGYIGTLQAYMGSNVVLKQIVNITATTTNAVDPFWIIMGPGAGYVDPSCPTSGATVCGVYGVYCDAALSCATTGLGCNVGCYSYPNSANVINVPVASPPAVQIWFQ